MPNAILNSKLPKVSTTIFTHMSVLAQQHGAVNLGQGFPDYAMDQKVMDYVTQAMQEGHNQYIHANGLPTLRLAIAEKVKSIYKKELNSDTEITITPGGTYAIFNALSTIINKGDEVIIFEPAYDSYIPNIELNGGIVKPIILKSPEFKIDWDEVKATINNKTKAIVINTPHNPSGMVFTHNDWLALQEIVVHYNLYCIADEVYEHLVLNGASHFSALSYPALYERSFVCFSLGKVYNCTGWKIGYCIAPENLTLEFRKLHQFNAFCVHAPAQHAFAKILLEPESYLSLSPVLQSKQSYLEDALAATPLKAIPTFGSYFQLYSFATINNKTDIEMAEQLTKEAGVTTIPLSAFYSNNLNQQVLRFCFAKKETTINLAAERLVNYFNSN
jgi:methionine transaminase